MPPPPGCRRKRVGGRDEIKVKLTMKVIILDKIHPSPRLHQGMIKIIVVMYRKI